MVYVGYSIVAVAAFVNQISTRSSFGGVPTRPLHNHDHNILKRDQPAPSLMVAFAKKKKKKGKNASNENGDDYLAPMPPVATPDATEDVEVVDTTAVAESESTETVESEVTEEVIAEEADADEAPEESEEVKEEIIAEAEEAETDDNNDDDREDDAEVEATDVASEVESIEPEGDSVDETVASEEESVPEMEESDEAEAENTVVGEVDDELVASEEEPAPVAEEVVEEEPAPVAEAAVEEEPAPVAEETVEEEPVVEEVVTTAAAADATEEQETTTVAPEVVEENKESIEDSSPAGVEYYDTAGAHHARQKQHVPFIKRAISKAKVTQTPEEAIAILEPVQQYLQLPSRVGGEAIYELAIAMWQRDGTNEDAIQLLRDLQRANPHLRIQAREALKRTEPPRRGLNRHQTREWWS